MHHIKSGRDHNIKGDKGPGDKTCFPSDGYPPDSWRMRENEKDLTHPPDRYPADIHRISNGWIKGFAS